MQQALLNYAGLALGIIGIVASAYFAIRFAERKLPRAHFVTSPRIVRSREATSDISLTYRGNVVERVNNTTLWLWNHGRKPIQATDVPASDPLQVILFCGSVQVEILDVIVRRQSRPAIAFTFAQKAPDTLEVSFAFLDSGDGVALDILHTGSPITQVAVRGTVLGAPSGFAVSGYGTSRLAQIHRTSLSPPVYSKTSKKERLAATLVVLAFGGACSVLPVLGAGEIVTTPELLQEAMRPFVTGPDQASVIQAVEESSKYKFLNRYGIPIFWAGAVLATLGGLTAVWSKGYPFPASLLLGRAESPDEGAPSTPR